MPEITFKEFKGISLDPKLWPQAYSGYSVGFDLYGLSINTGSAATKSGFLHPIYVCSAGAEATGVSAVTEDIGGFARFSGNDYAVGIVASNPARMYKRD